MVFPAPRQHTSKCIPAPVLKSPTVIRAGPRCGHTGQVNNLAPLKINTFSAQDRAGRHFLSAHPQTAGNFWKSSISVETSISEHHTSKWSSNILVPFLGWFPGQLPGWPSLQLAIKEVTAILRLNSHSTELHDKKQAFCYPSFINYEL